jgi:hypothetical protein
MFCFLRVFCGDISDFDPFGRSQHIGVYGELGISSGFAEALQVEPIVLVRIEAGLAIVAPLDNVLGDKVTKVVVDGSCTSPFAQSVKRRLGYHISSSLYSDPELRTMSHCIEEFGLWISRRVGHMIPPWWCPEIADNKHRAKLPENPTNYRIIRAK